jgi:hypothetical protein
MKKVKKKVKPKSASNGESHALHDAFTAGLRYALARHWVSIDNGGGVYMLEQAYQEVLRCEMGQHPPDIIDTNYGARLAWEAEFDKLRVKFKRTGLPAALTRKTRKSGVDLKPVPAPRLPGHRPRKAQVEWETEDDNHTDSDR